MKTAIFVTASTLGKGDDGLGNILMKNFFLTFSEKDSVPEYILFVNEGVFLAAEGSPVLDTLELLSEKGTQVLSCGTCLDFYKLKEKLKVGTVTNMYTITDILSESKVITL